MARRGPGIADQCVHDAPFAVVDFETTGLSPGPDRVVELSVVRMEPGSQPRLVLDTLINPERPVAATEIHGITDADVTDAPTFGDVAGDLIRKLSGCAVAAYNVYFDIRFLDYELRRVARIDHLPPHLCLMYLRPMLGLGKRCPLQDACACHGIDTPHAHEAWADALAGAQLLSLYLRQMKERGIRTFADLASLRRYKFVESFAGAPLSDSLVSDYPSARLLKSRAPQDSGPASEADHPVRADLKPRNPLAEYMDALKVAMADLRITDEEIADLEERKRSLGLKDEQIRMLHARIFASVIGQFIEDQWLDDRECRVLHRIHSCLARLGWAPGNCPGHSSST